MARFFIDRPIFSAVLSIVLTVAGTVAILVLPIAQYPEIAPPTVQVSATYPGANAQVVADTVAAPIEQQVNGVENMLYMSSNSANDGSYNLTVTFKLGTNLDMAQVLVQNRVSLAMPTLPDMVKATGVSTKKKSANILLVVNLFSPDKSREQLYISNYATIQVKDELARIEGVGDVAMFGQQDYSMRMWLDPDRMASRQLTATDVINALKEQNVQVAAGQIGQPPVPKGIEFQYTMSTLGRLSDPEQFRSIVLKRGADGGVTFLRDVAQVELGAKTQDQTCTMDGKSSAALAIFQLPGSNALATADRIRAKMDELKKRFPSGVDYAIVYDTTPFTRESIKTVIHTLFEAFILVALVVMVFLQNWRTTLIPLIAVPVSLVGTFAVMALLGFSLNNLSLFGLVLAIGIVVDDAIVVVENVERWIEHGLSPKEASYKTMDEVTVAVVAIAFGLSAVFIPTAFVSGITGQFYRQFALTIATSTLISAFNSLTLSPALAALLLKPHGAKKDPFTRLLDFLFGWFFKGFNKVFNWTTEVYGHAVAWCLRGAAVCMLIYAGLLVLTWFGFTRVPVGFIPSQDKGYVMVSVQLPDSASLQRTEDAVRRAEQIALNTKGVAHTVTISGQSLILNTNGSNLGSMFITFDEFEHREGPELYVTAIQRSLQQQMSREIEEAQIAVLGAPPVDGIGNAGGFKVMVEDRGNNGLPALQGQTDNLVDKSKQVPQIGNMFTQFRAQVPQLYADIDRVKCKSLGVGLTDVFNTLQVYLGGYYVNDFNEFGRTWQVNLQALAPFRVDPKQIERMKVRTASGEMVPLGTLARIRDSTGPLMITRYNLYPAATVNGVPAPRISSAQAITAVNALSNQELPASMAHEWTELAFLQNLEGNTAVFIFPLCLLFVFLTHAAEYESWALPLGIILIVPMSILCALAGIAYRGLDNDIFTQIGFIVLVGLACKNAVLIIEFAKQQEEHEGMKPFEATFSASKLRLRPIIMTSFAFILGVVPLMLGKGAGAEMRRTLGTAVFSGMLGVTIFGIFLTPAFYIAIRWLSGNKPFKHAHKPKPPTAPVADDLLDELEEAVH
jgi:multidrug efflux pump